MTRATAAGLAVLLACGCGRVRERAKPEDPAPQTGGAATIRATTPPTHPARVRAREDKPAAVAKLDPPPAKLDPPAVVVPRVPTLRELMTGADTSRTAPDLWADYRANAVAADQRYKGRSLCVVGAVDRITTDVRGRGAVVLVAGAGQLENVVCYFDRANAEPARLARGDTAVIVGECRGKLAIQVSVEGCRLIVSDPDPHECNRKVIALRDGGE